MTALISNPSSAANAAAAVADDAADKLLRAHKRFARTLRDTHYGHHVKEYEAVSPPSAVAFAKHVGSNTPFIVRNFVSQWSTEAWSSPSVTEKPSFETGERIERETCPKWSNTFLLDVMRGTEVSVAVTMDGRADAVVSHPSSTNTSEKDPDELRTEEEENEERVFTTPHTATLPFSTAVRYLLDKQRHFVSSPISSHHPIIYLQAQNDCLRAEYPLLQQHLPLAQLHPPWITEVLGAEPEAINLWIGTRHSVSTLHSDPYENVYVVLRGRKTFWLAPPGEAWWYCKRRFRTAQWQPQPREGHEAARTEVPVVQLIKDEPPTKIPWYPVPHPEHIPEDTLARYSRLLHRPKPYKVTVEAGDMLYLPRGWLHHVEQEEDEDGLCVAVNSWFEGWDGGMGRDWGWGRFVDAVERIVVGGGKDVEDEEEDEEDEEEEEEVEDYL